MRSNSVNYIVTCFISFRTMRFNKFKFNISFHAYSMCWNMKRENALNVPKYNKDLFAPHFLLSMCTLCVAIFYGSFALSISFGSQILKKGHLASKTKNLLGVTSHNFLFILSRNYWEYKKWLSEIKAKINDNLTSERGRRWCRALLRLCSVVGNTNRFETEKKKVFLSHFLCLLLIPLNYKNTERKENSQQQQQ